MKKYFLFAAVAGMLASCSSDSLTAGSDPTIEPTQEERVPIKLGVASQSVRATTRGTGTVGGVGVDETDASNVWYGQRINAFMFTKDKDTHATTLNLALVDPTNTSSAAYYDNAVMITPGTAENLIPGESTAKSIGEAMLADKTIQYYPSSGNFDFFGYHGDDAITGAVDKTTAASTLWTVPFTITGSQDLMSTKAAPLPWAKLTAEQKGKFADEDAYKAFINGTGTLLGDFYSAKAARKLIQPVLSFNHLLSRLSFVIKAGNDNAGGWVAATTYTAAEANTHNAALPGALSTVGNLGSASVANAYNATLSGAKAADAQLTASEAATYNSKLDGALPAGVALDATQVAAYNLAIDPDKSVGETLTEDEANAYNATLAGALTSGTALSASDANAYNAKLTGAKTKFDTLTEDEANTYNATLAGAVHEGEDKPGGAAHQDLDKAVYVKSIEVYSKRTGKMAVAWTADPGANMITWTGDGSPDWLALQERPYAYENANPTNFVSKAFYDGLAAGSPGKDDYTLTGDNTNYNLIALTPTCPNMTASGNYPETSIGEALIVAPKDADNYEMRVKVSQKVQTNWGSATLQPKDETYELLIPAPGDDPATGDVNEGKFEANTSYKVILTVYGFERIEVTTKIIPWETGADIPVGQD